MKKNHIENGLKNIKISLAGQGQGKTARAKGAWLTARKKGIRLTARKKGRGALYSGVEGSAHGSSVGARLTARLDSRGAITARRKVRLSTKWDTAHGSGKRGVSHGWVAFE
ncbi:hypothetical protein Csa_005024 [Cucumis sativus]|uniref:Uncharacterized protein n=1 Tax=Cucumis sativus TaxID=3659 RepID=A0A0A0K8M6_CUCSA|nr:hypothetical protein Csa_005024 [Cucumis sativus]